MQSKKCSYSHALAFSTLAALIAWQSCAAQAQSVERSDVRAAIAAAVRRPDGSPHQWCTRPAQGCDAYVEAIAAAFERSAERHGLDVWLLVAIASVESGFNPYARGSADELGILQHHPRWHPGLQMLTLGARECQHRADVCQSEAIERGARSLARRIRRCRDLRTAVAGHNQGRCAHTPKARRYARRVWARRTLLTGGA